MKNIELTAKLAFARSADEKVASLTRERFAFREAGEHAKARELALELHAALVVATDANLDASKAARAAGEQDLAREKAVQYGRMERLEQSVADFLNRRQA
jgi:hypothetical protein